MSCAKIRNTLNVHHSHTSILFIGCIAHFILSLKRNELNHYYQIKKHALQCPYRTCARARVMGEVKEVQEQMKADTEALKEKMATMMSIKEIMEVSAAYQTRARARVMGEVEEVQEQRKADMEEKMATMVEAMISMKKIMEANTVAVSATSAVAKVNPMPPSDLNQMNHPTSDMVGNDLGSTDGPMM